MRMNMLGACLIAIVLMGPKVLVAQAVPAPPGEAWLSEAFEEPLESLGNMAPQKETEALRTALEAYARSNRSDAMGPLEAFLGVHPDSPWRASLYMNMGLALRRAGWPGKAMANFERAWVLAKTDQGPAGQRIANRAVTEWMWLCMKAGDDATLERLIRVTAERPMRGGSAQRRADAERALFAMQKEAKFYLCGPTALATVNNLTKPNHPIDPRDVKDTIPGPDGTSLFQLAMMASHWDIPLQMAKRDPGAKVLTPSVMHWKVGHWAAVLQEADGHYLVQEDVLEEAVWVRREALDSETSGYCLAPYVSLPQGWSRVSAEEGRTVWGRGRVGLGPWYGPYPDSVLRPRIPPSPAVAQAGVRMGNQSLEIWLAPISLPRHDGPAWPFELRYQQRIAWQPDRPHYSHLGPHWTFTGISYLIEDESFERQDVQLFTETGTWLRFTGFDPATRQYARNYHTRDLLLRLGAGRYELHRPDGSIEIFAHAAPAGLSLRRVFRTERKSPTRSSVRYEFDKTQRLQSVTGENGKGFTFHYESPQDRWCLSRVTDSFGREARFKFNEQGQLAEVIDAAGGKTRLVYPEKSLTPDVLQGVATPEGNWSFESGQVDLNRWIEIVDPAGKRHRSEFRHDAPGLPTADAVAPVGPLNQYMHDRGTYYWGPEVLARHRGNYSKAESIRYLFNPTQLALSWSLESVKQAENPRIWFLYSGQANTQVEGTSAQPRWIAQKSSRSEAQLGLRWNERRGLTALQNGRGVEAAWVDCSPNQEGIRLSNINSPGESMRWEWSDAGTLIRVRNGKQVLWEAHRDDLGIIHQIRDSKGHLWRLTYDESGRWVGIQGRVSFRWTFDAMGRVTSLQQGNGKVVTLAYDGLDRLIVGEGKHVGTTPEARNSKLVWGEMDEDKLLTWVAIPEFPSALPTSSVVRKLMNQDNWGSVVVRTKSSSTSSSRVGAGQIEKWIKTLRGLETPTVTGRFTEHAPF